MIDIPADGSKAAVAASSVDTLASALERATERASAMGAAVKAAESSYAAAEAGANKTARALEKMNAAVTAQEGKLAKALEAGDASSIEAASEKLENLKARQAEAASAAEQAATKMQQEAENLDKLRAAASGAAEEQKNIADQLAKANAAAGSGKANEAAEALAKFGGPLGSVGQKLFSVRAGWDKLKGTFGDKAPLIAGAVGIVAIAAAVAALVVGLGVGAVKLAAWAISNADAARTSALLSQGIMGSVEGGLALDKAIDAVGKTVPIAADELRGMAADLAKTGLKGDDLSAALQEAATKAAKLKFGPDFAKQMLSLDFQAQKLRADVGKIFGGLKIEGLLSALQKVGNLFDAESSSAKAIKVVFESLFQPLVDGAAAMIPKVVAAFIQFEIWAMRGLIAIKPYGSTLLMIGGAIATAIGAGVVVFGALVAAMVGAVALTVVMIDAAMRLGQAMAGGAAYGVGFLMAQFQEVKAWFASFSLSDVGVALIDGLASGLVSAGPKVLQAITGVASGAIAAAKKILGIKSPSKVFAEIGENTAAGMAEGVDSGSADVQTGLEKMAAPPSITTAGAPSEKGSGGGGGNVYNTITVQVDGAGKDGAAIGDEIAEKLRDFLEGLSRQGGEAAAA